MALVYHFPFSNFHYQSPFSIQPISVATKTPKTLYVCQSCGHESPRWSGRCPQCSEWNTFVETVVSSPLSHRGRKSPKQPKLLNLSGVESGITSRIATGIAEFDRVLGGGIVPGSVILLAGEPGVGKSTLLLQVAAAVSENREQRTENRIENGKRKADQSSVLGHRSRLPSSDISLLYVSGEESPSQLKLRADRLGIRANNIQVLAETDVDAIIYEIENREQKTENRIEDRKQKADPSSVLRLRSSLPPSDIRLLVIDSAQTLTTQDLSAGAGTISQVRECARRLSLWAKEAGIPLILVGHVTKEGSIAGPKVLEHMVDVVLYLEGDKFHAFRLLRAHKNRYGSDQEVGVFAMGDRGLSEVENPSDIFLSERLKNASGSVVTATMEGTRPVLVEIQALATNSPLAYPRRTASGLGLNRLNLLIAVLQKHLKLPLQNKDIYVNVAGGFKVSEPAADLAVALAIVSSVKESPIDPRTCVFGEVGLSGEVRKVSQSERRAKEAKKLGFTKIISPESVRSLGEVVGKLKVQN